MKRMEENKWHNSPWYWLLITDQNKSCFNSLFRLNNNCIIFNAVEFLGVTFLILSFHCFSVIRKHQICWRTYLFSQAHGSHSESLWADSWGCLCNRTYFVYFEQKRMKYDLKQTMIFYIPFLWFIIRTFCSSPLFNSTQSWYLMTIVELPIRTCVTHIRNVCKMIHCKIINTYL